ncbi:hypothetical protein EVAR_74983_1 [Eumeta japonica]|uniref:Uncharacterized protein n=1 Tax=Eumeta variegata TaxID=151549 RepID=A0A4C1V9R9_EUMVA|nr:hypothetical protein EVAR_74983_1 [Eumeta japonica]
MLKEYVKLSVFGEHTVTGLVTAVVNSPRLALSQQEKNDGPSHPANGMIRPPETLLLQIEERLYFDAGTLVHYELRTTDRQEDNLRDGRLDLTNCSRVGRVRPLSLFRSLVPRSHSHARLRRNATISHALSCVQPAFIDL